MIKLSGKNIKLPDIEKILFGNEKIEIPKETTDKVNRSFEFLLEFQKNKIIYGVNTGFGPMSQHIIKEKDRIQLQYNLIRSHTAGSGEVIPFLYVKAIMLARLNSLIQGYSGIHENVVELLKEFINNDVYPLIYEHGGVGASGDLVQLAHLASALLGEGEVNYDGKIQPSKDVLKKMKLKPMNIYLREGLALINGTSAMTGIGLVNLIKAKKLLNWSILCSAFINEIAESYDDHLSNELNDVKFHSGQKKVAEMMRAILKDSKLIRKRHEHLFNNHIPEKILKEKVQEFYSIRCIPQILGPIYDTIEKAEEVLMNEFNSANDNPIVDAENNNVFHGGNFHGDYVSFEMDKLKIAVTKLSMLCERQLNFLMNDKLNEKLPPFLNLGTLGLNLGMQGMQFTATSTVAENQTLSYPMYLHSIPNNNDNQDIVSMGANSALLAKKVIDNSFEVISIEIIALMQAVDYLGIEKKLSKKTKLCYNEMRKIAPKFIEDTPKHNIIENIKSFLLENNFSY